MSDIVHILDRAVIHFFCSAGVYLIALWGFWLLERKVSWWPQLRGWWELILPAAAPFGFISLREVFDVAGGGSPLKSVCVDQLASRPGGERLGPLPAGSEARTGSG